MGWMAPPPWCAGRAEGRRAAVPRDDGSPDPSGGDLAGSSRLLALRELRSAARGERHALRELRTPAQSLGTERLSVGDRATDRSPRGSVPLGTASHQAVRRSPRAGVDRLARGPAAARAREADRGGGGANPAAAAHPPALTTTR